MSAMENRIKAILAKTNYNVDDMTEIVRIRCRHTTVSEKT